MPDATYKSVKINFLLLHAAVLIIQGCAFALVVYLSFEGFFERAIVATHNPESERLWMLSQDILGDRARLATAIENAFNPEARGRFIRLSIDGTILYQSRLPARPGADTDPIPLPSDIRPEAMRSFGDFIVYSEQYRGPEDRLVTIELGHYADPRQTDRTRLLLAIGIGLPVLVTLSVFGGFLLMQRTLDRVEAMISGAETLTFNAPQARLPMSGRNERIDNFSHSLNRMLERLDSAYQQASRFSADAAHELRTPLAIMRGELELIDPAQLPDSVRAAMSTVLGETIRLGEMIESLLEIAHLDGVGGKDAHRPIDLQALVAQAVDQIAPLAEARNIAIAVHATGSVETNGDPDRLNQVVINLLDNAIKYNIDGGRIRIDISGGDDEVLLAISDTGIGIAREHLPRIFDRFYRVATDRGEVGSGLGLAIVKAICMAHGGRITAESRPGRGTTFTVSLPRAAFGAQDGRAAGDHSV